MVRICGSRKMLTHSEFSMWINDWLFSLNDITESDVCMKNWDNVAESVIHEFSNNGHFVYRNFWMPLICSIWNWRLVWCLDALFAPYTLWNRYIYYQVLAVFLQFSIKKTGSGNVKRELPKMNHMHMNEIKWTDTISNDNKSSYWQYLKKKVALVMWMVGEGRPKQCAWI